MARIEVKVNGERATAEVEPQVLLVHFLRDVLNLTGTHIGCVIGRCGACTVLWNGRAVKSCMVYAIQADGGEITTVEGLEGDGGLPRLMGCFSRILEPTRLRSSAPSPAIFAVVPGMSIS